MPTHRNTPLTFSREEMRQIRAQLNTPRARVECPICGEALTLIGPIVCDNSMGPTFEVVCEPCLRTTILTDVPGMPRSDSES